MIGSRAVATDVNKQKKKDESLIRYIDRINPDRRFHPGHFLAFHLNVVQQNPAVSRTVR